MKIHSDLTVDYNNNEWCVDYSEIIDSKVAVVVRKLIARHCQLT